MKLRACLLASLLALSIPAVYAVEEHHPPEGDKAQPQQPAQAPGAAGMMGGMGMMDMQRMQRMQDLLKQARETEDPAKRRELLREHTKELQKAMQAMGGAKGGMDMMACMQMMNPMGMMQRMGMMQQLMEQMLERQSLMLE